MSWKESAMPRFFVSFSLQQQNFNYSPLFSVLQKAGAERVLETGWLLHAKQDVAELSRVLLALVGPTDRLMVTTIGPGAPWAASRISEAGKAWLQNPSATAPQELSLGLPARRVGRELPPL
jgi:hypothetical protein